MAKIAAGSGRQRGPVDGRLHVIEYSDLPDDVAERRKPTARWKSGPGQPYTP